MSVQAPPVWTPEQPHSLLEKSALGKVVWFGIIWIVGVLAGWVLDFYIFWTAFSSSSFYNLPQNPTPSQVSSAMGPLFQYASLTVPVTLAIELLGVIMLTLAFRDLRKIDSASFSLPATLMLLLIAGAIIVGAAAVPMVYNMPGIIAHAPYSSGSAPSSAFISAIGGIFAYLAVAAIGGLIALVGVLGGVLLGVWRLGTRYDETLFKVGAIFVIIPFLNILAPILILIAASQVRGRLPGNP